jgi:elongation factor G
MDGSLIPVFCGSVEKDLGIQELLDGIVNLAPPPLAKEKVALEEGELELNEDGDGVAFVFKSIIDPFVGQLTVLRVYSGKITSDSELINLNNGKKERIGALLLMNGAEQANVTEAGPGDVIGIAKLTSTQVNQTLSTNGELKPVAPIEYPKPNAMFAVYSKAPGDEDKINAGLTRLSQEDPTIILTREPETGETLLIGMGMQHIGIITQRLQETNKVEIDLRTPKVPYRETIQGKGDQRYRHKKQTGGRGQFAEVALRLEALQDEMFEFANEVVGGNIPRNYIPAVEKGVVNTMQKGPLANCRVINIKATVYDGKHHPVDSSDMAFQIASSYAFREAMKQANPIILEPIQKVCITIPDDYMGDVSGDLNSRRGRILGMGTEDGLQVVEAEVPLAEMFSYPSQLRSLTQGRGSFEMEFLRYDPVPGNVSSQIQEAAAKEREEEH